MADEQYERFMEQRRAWATTLPEAVQHHYAHARANEPIGLYRGPFQLAIQGRPDTYDADGHFSLRWLPTPRILYQAEVDIDPITAVNYLGADWSSALPSMPQVPDQVDADYQEPKAPKAAMATSGQEFLVVVGGSQEVTHVTFGLVNFIELHGTHVRNEEHAWRGRVVLTAGDWSIVLDQRREHDELTKQLSTSGGYAFTHVGELKRTDGAPFLPADAKSILEALHYFFSFALGSFTGPMLPVGYGQGGQPTWAEWACRTTDPWLPAYHWCDSYHPEQLAELFPAVHGQVA